MNHKRIFVLGLDGACENTIGVLYAQGAMPNLRSLLNGRPLQRLRSTPLPITPASWASMYTGKLPGKTGILTFERRTTGYGTRIVNARDVVSGIYSILPRHGRRILSVGFPMTSPVPEAPGSVIVSGWDSLPNEPLCNNGRWLAKLDEYGYSLQDEFTADEATLRKAIEARFALLSAMTKQEAWDCSMLYLGFIDTLGHRLGAGNEQAVRLLALVDEQLGALTPSLGDCEFVLCSDHGFGRFSRSFSLLQWLAENHYLTLTSTSFPTAHALGGFEVGAMDFNSGSVVWPRTKAFAYDAVGSYGGIRLNVSGRYPEGTVSPSNAWSLAGEIAERLAGTRDPKTGERIVARVSRREELFWGPYVHEFPEVIVETVPDTVVFVGKRSRTEGGYRLDEGFVHEGSFDSHVPDGVWASSFPVEELEGVQDVGPTLCALMDVPMDPDIDGRSRCASAVVPMELPAGYTSDEEDIVRKRLEDLGYL